MRNKMKKNIESKFGKTKKFTSRDHLICTKIRGDLCPNQVIVQIKNTWGVNGVCPEKLSKLGKLSELSVSELTGIYCSIGFNGRPQDPSMLAPSVSPTIDPLTRVRFSSKRSNCGH